MTIITTMKINKTDRGHFYNSTVYSFMKDFLKNFSGTVLDYGAGRKAIFAKKLSEIHPVDAYDIGENFNENHVELTPHDVIYASNVLNVQETPEMLDATLREIRANCSMFIFNYPQAPRVMGMSKEDMLIKVSEYFTIFKANKDVYIGS